MPGMLQPTSDMPATSDIFSHCYRPGNRHRKTLQVAWSRTAIYPIGKVPDETRFADQIPLWH